MVAKKKSRSQKYDEEHDWRIIRAIKFCWDRGYKFYPVVVKGQSRSFKTLPDCYIELAREGHPPTKGKEIYKQNDELWDKMEQLYLHMYEKLGGEQKKI